MSASTGRSRASRHGGGWLPRSTYRSFVSRLFLSSLILVFSSGLANAAPSRSPDLGPVLSVRTDAPLAATGGVLALLGPAIHLRTQAVPATGLDPARIHWGIDRHVVGREHDPHAGPASNATLSGAVALPFVSAFVSEHGAERWRAPVRRIVPYIEATLLSDGITTILKRGIARPRPFTYLADANRPAHPEPASSFESFPSGHASHSFCAAAFTITDHLRSRPDANWKEHAGVGLLAGAVAGTTAVLRVRAGVHFPTDVAAGALVGIVCGTTVPLLHRYQETGGAGHSQSGRVRSGNIAAAVSGAAVGVAGAVLVGELAR